MTTTRDTLKSFVERVERLDEEIKSLNDDKRDIYAEAKSGGFDVPVLKKVIARRRLDTDKREELDALIDTYELALSGRDENNAPAATAERMRATPDAPTRTRAMPAESKPNYGDVISIAPAFRSYTDAELEIPDFLRRA